MRGPTRPQIIWGKVSVASPLTVIIDGDGTTGTVITSKLDSYSSPQVNDRVALVRSGNGYMALGKRVAA